MAAVAVAWPHRSDAKERPLKTPNVVFIMADDMGYGDVGCYHPASKIPTPHMDRLAREGVRFTDAHAPSAVCTPTRYGVLTGRYCWRTWLQRGVVGGYTPPLIEPTRTTVASLLQQHGYATACIGKWHLGLGWPRRNGLAPTWEDAQRLFRGSWQDGDPATGMNVDFTKPIQGGPTALGFTYAYFTAACSTIDGPFCYIENDRTVGIPDKPIAVDKKKHPDHRPRPGWVAPEFELENVDPTFTRKAVEFMERTRAEKPQRPFFLYLALSAPMRRGCRRPSCKARAPPAPAATRWPSWTGASARSRTPSTSSASPATPCSSSPATTGHAKAPTATAPPPTCAASSPTPGRAAIASPSSPAGQAEPSQAP